MDSGIETDGLEQDGHRHLATAVDAEVQDVFRIELEVEPGATVGNDARRKQKLARAVGLALVVLEKHARRAVQLRDDDTLGAVDDEGALFGHERHFAHVDLLLLDLFDHLGLRRRRLAVINDQLHLGAHGRRKGQAARLALAHIKGRLGQVVLEKLHLHKPVVRDDGESVLEGGLQALSLSLTGRAVCLQKCGVRVFLHLQHIGDCQHAFAVAEALAYALALGEGIGHEFSAWKGRDETVFALATVVSTGANAPAQTWWLATTNRWRTAMHCTSPEPRRLLQSGSEDT
jgi:hypothetical protein